MTPLFARAGALAVFLLIAACASPPFNYAQDRCQGGHNQCQAQCASLNDGPARSACQQRCLTVEDRCYISGEPAAGSTLAEESLIRRARTQEEKEAAYEVWKTQRERDRAAAEARGESLESDSAILEIIE